MNPNIGRIHVHKNGHVAKDSDAALFSSPLKMVPLLREGKLQDTLDGDCATVLLFSLRKRLWIATPQGLRPFSPSACLKFTPQNGVECIVVEPRGLVAAKFLVICPLLPEAIVVESAIQKISGRLLEQGQFSRFNFIKIHGARPACKPGDALTFDPFPFGQKFEADEPGISGESRRPRVGRVSVPRGTK